MTTEYKLRDKTPEQEKNFIELVKEIRLMIDATPGLSRTEKIKLFSNSIGCGRTHLYEMLDGSRDFASAETLRKLYHLGIPAELLLNS